MCSFFSDLKFCSKKKKAEKKTEEKYRQRVQQTYAMEINGNNSEDKTRKKRNVTLTKEDVIAKLKDEGDFDNLRLKIIRKLKDNEELRNNIVSIIRQSSVLDRAGAETMKPRQLSDAIYDEVGDKMMSQLSDGLWKIIRSEDGMKTEITRTVQSVYDKLVEPEIKARGESSKRDGMPDRKEVDDSGTSKDSTAGAHRSFSNSVPLLGSALCNNNHKRNCEHKEEIQVARPSEVPFKEHTEWENRSQDVTEKGDGIHHLQPVFSSDTEYKQPYDGSDEDPDVPPGFG